MVIRGGPEDEAGAFWNAVDLDQRRSPAELGISPIRPLEIRMRRAAPKAVPLAPEPEPRAFLAKGGVAGAMAGAAGAIIAWMLTGLWDDLGELLFSFQMLDLAVAMLLGALVGAAVGLSDAARNRRSMPLATLIGAALGAAGGALGGFLAVVLSGLISNDASTRGFILVRIGAWGAVGLGIGLLTGLAYVRSDRRRLLDGAIWGLGGGLVAGLMYSLPGPADLWNAVAFALLGTAIGAGLCGPTLQRSHAILERETARGGPFRLFGIREWALRSTSTVQIEDASAKASIEPHEGGFVIRPRAKGDGSVRVGGQAVGEGVRLRNGDTLDLAGSLYVFRRMRSS